MILDPGLNLTLRPMRYPVFYELYKAAIKNTWTIEEIEFEKDINDLKKMTPAERHMVNRLVAFFATGDTIVNNNAAVELYRNINSPEARMYLSRQIYEESVHIDFYLRLLDTYLPDPGERAAAFAAVENVPSIKRKADFCARWMEGSSEENLLAFCLCVEGIFFFSAFAYVYFLRSRGLLPGLAAGTNWVFRDESGHLGFGLEVIKVIQSEYPEFQLGSWVEEMIRGAVACESEFADDLLGGGVPGLSVLDMKQYIQYVADLRLKQVGLLPIYNVKNPLQFMEQQDVQELGNFFERRVTAYQVGVTGQVKLDEDF